MHCNQVLGRWKMVWNSPGKTHLDKDIRHIPAMQGMLKAYLACSMASVMLSERMERPSYRSSSARTDVSSIFFPWGLNPPNHTPVSAITSGQSQAAPARHGGYTRWASLGLGPLVSQRHLHQGKVKVSCKMPALDTNFLSKTSVAWC